MSGLLRLEPFSAYHEIPEIQISVHFSDIKNLHLIRAAWCGDGQLILTLRTSFLPSEMLKALAQLSEECDVSVGFRWCFRILVVDLSLALPS